MASASHILLSSPPGDHLEAYDSIHLVAFALAKQLAQVQLPRGSIP